MQYLGYCTVCNSTNINPSFNLMTQNFDTSPIQVGNPCLTSVFISASQNFTKNLSSLSPFNWLSPSLSLTLYSLNLHALCLFINPSSPLLTYSTQTHQQKQRKNLNSPEIPTPIHASFLDPDQRESKGWGLERIGCRERH